MSWINQSTHWFFVFAVLGVGGVTHLIYQRSLRCQRRRIDELSDHNQSLQSTTEQAIHDERVARLENSLLRDFLAKPDAKSALGEMLRRYSIKTDDFAAYVEVSPDEATVIDSSGLRPKSRAGFYVSRDLCTLISAKRVLTLEGAELFNSPLMSGLTRDDRRKVSSIVCIACDAPSGNAGIFVTTGFPLERVDRDRQIELTVRLLDCIYRHYQQSHRVSAQEDELVMANDVMHLRGLVDRDFKAIDAMANMVLEHLAAQLGAYRAAYFEIDDQPNSKPQRVTVVGKEPQPNLIPVWENAEDVLAHLGMGCRTHKLLAEDTLKGQLEIKKLVATALVIPLLKGGQPSGVVCLTWGGPKKLDRAELKLVEWCVESLADGFSRVKKYVQADRESKEDGLTQLVNRRKFDQQLEIELEMAQRDTDTLGLLLLDLDRFKSVNDTYGHQAGDEVLRVAAERLRQEVKKVRGGDRILLARYGGEEMAVVLPKFDTPGAKRVAESIRKAIAAKPIVHDRRSIPVTTSIGLAIYPHHANTSAGLVEFADQGLYEAKETGRNRVCVASTQPTTH